MCSYADPRVKALVREVQAEYVVRYGSPDEAPVDPGQFEPPRGLFLLGTLGGTAVSMGGWRVLRPGTVEVKRMFVVASARRRGVAAATLAELERTAGRAGHTHIVLETGNRQPEAIELYRVNGYRPVEPFGHYKDADASIHLGKELAGDISD